jgi:hypothetical protein
LAGKFHIDLLDDILGALIVTIAQFILNGTEQSKRLPGKKK